jgi:hypothetical protein
MKPAPAVVPPFAPATDPLPVLCAPFLSSCSPEDTVDALEVLLLLVAMLLLH